jgi:hypothetical protein
MSDRLLTREEIDEFYEEARRRVNQFAQDTEGNFTPDDIDAIYGKAELAKLEAQDAKTRKLTLKEVGEWLEKRKYGCERDTIIKVPLLREELEALKRGEMPK